MTDWFRSWHGAPTDTKWLGIARHAGVVPGIAVAVAWALMDRASQSSDRGSIEGYDADGLAYFFGCEPEQVDAIVVAMTEKGMIVEGRFAAWEKRQPRREDDSSERVSRHRATKRNDTKRNVTQGNAPETDTEAEKKQIAQQQEPAAGAACSRPSLDEIERGLFQAAGIAGFREERHPKLMDLSPIINLMDRGYDLDRDILPVIRAKSRNKTFNSWRFFVDAVVDAASQKQSIPAISAAPAIDWPGWIAVWAESGTWSPAIGPKPGEKGCRAPPELLAKLGSAA